MTDNIKLLVGSLSNDLLRTATFSARDTKTNASRFAIEAKRWAEPLQHLDVPQYIKDIATHVATQSTTDISLPLAERYLMYSVLLQNFALHHKVE